MPVIQLLQIIGMRLDNGMHHTCHFVALSTGHTEGVCEVLLPVRLHRGAVACENDNRQDILGAAGGLDHSPGSMHAMKKVSLQLLVPYGILCVAARSNLYTMNILHQEICWQALKCLSSSMHHGVSQLLTSMSIM